MHYSLLTWRDNHMKQLKYQSQNAHNKRSGEISSCIFVKYKNSVRRHGCHINDT